MNHFHFNAQPLTKPCQKRAFRFLVSIVMPLSLSLFVACEQRNPAGGTSATKNYKWDTVIFFGKGGGSEAFRSGGWSDTEAHFTWTTGGSAKLVIPIAPSDRPLTLRMRLAGLTKLPELPAQTVELYANGQKLADWKVGDTADFTAVIPPEVVQSGGDLNIELKTPKAASPKSLGLGEDPRVLGVSCLELAISKSA